MKPDVLEKADTILSHLSKFTALEDQHPFVECATFADEIKGKGWNDQSGLHYTNMPFFDQGYHTEVPQNENNATWAIVSVRHALLMNV